MSSEHLRHDTDGLTNVRPHAEEGTLQSPHKAAQPQA
jgi:hypothetical protein